MSAGPEAVYLDDILVGRYRVERVLGRGGMGIVVKVLDFKRNKPRAMKLLTPEALTHPTAVERFLREARATSRLRSEHVVRVIEVGALDSGAPYMVMEYLEGKDLLALLRRRGTFPAHEAALYVMQACEALSEAHAQGIIHRDIKLQNLFLACRADGSPCIKVLDFGISKGLTPVRHSEVELTLSNTVLGSPAYMSPEQLLSARSADARSDIWSLGVVLYHLVTGRLPFRSDNARELVALVVRGDPVPPSKVRQGLPLALDHVIGRCIHRDPSRRFARVDELAAALAPFVPVAHRPSHWPRGRPAQARRRGLLALVATGATVLVISALLAVVFLR